MLYYTSCSAEQRETPQRPGEQSAQFCNRMETGSRVKKTGDWRLEAAEYRERLRRERRCRGLESSQRNSQEGREDNVGEYYSINIL